MNETWLPSSHIQYSRGQNSGGQACRFCCVYISSSCEPCAVTVTTSTLSAPNNTEHDACALLLLSNAWACVLWAWEGHVLAWEERDVVGGLDAPSTSRALGALMSRLALLLLSISHQLPPTPFEFCEFYFNSQFFNEFYKNKYSRILWNAIRLSNNVSNKSALFSR